VDQGSAEHPGDDLRVPVLVHVESGPGVDDVLVVDSQQPVRVRGQVEVAREGEALQDSSQP